MSKISKKHAGLIREGIVRARQHTGLVTSIIRAGGFEILMPVLDITLRDIPRHPLSMRAYVRATEAATAKLKPKSGQVTNFHD